MSKFKVKAECVTDVYIILDAETAEEAEANAEQIDGSEWIAEESGGDWRINYGLTTEVIEDDDNPE